MPNKINWFGIGSAWHAISIVRGQEVTNMDDIKTLTHRLFDSRRTGATNPDGKFEEVTGFWYPSKNENHGTIGSVKKPDRQWPHSYLVHCRSKKHCKALVLAALALKDVPADVLDIVTRPEPKKTEFKKNIDDTVTVGRAELLALIRDALASARL